MSSSTSPTDSLGPIIQKIRKLPYQASLHHTTATADQIKSLLDSYLTRDNPTVQNLLYPPKLSEDEMKKIMEQERIRALEERANGTIKKGVPCGYVFKKGEAVYRCRTCGLDDTVVLCSKCFHATNHEGHDTLFHFSSMGGGCCDCLDPECWKREMDCLYHGITTPAI